jgi:hypothetical protein
VICGDPNPDGPGIKEADHTSVFAGMYASRVQPVSLGSYVRVPHTHAFDVETSGPLLIAALGGSPVTGHSTGLCFRWDRSRFVAVWRIVTTTITFRALSITC